jgi:hypothetical protein
LFAFLLSNEKKKMKKNDISKYMVNSILDTKTEDFVKLSKTFGVVNRDGGGYFVGKEKKIMGGLIKKMKRTFYPLRQETLRKRGTSSTTGGVRVHRQIYHIIHCIQSGICNCDVKTNVNRLNELTKNTLKKLKELEFTAIDAEVPLLSEKSNFCTRLDLIGYLWKGTEKQTSCFIELKTGYEKQWKRDGKGYYFLDPLQKVYASSRNINQLQAACCHSVMSEEYNFNFQRCIVLYINKEYKDCFAEEPLDWWWKNKKIGSEIYQKMCLEKQ